MVGSAYGFKAKQSKFLLPYSQEATTQEFSLVTKLCVMHNNVSSSSSLASLSEEPDELQYTI